MKEHQPESEGLNMKSKMVTPWAVKEVGAAPWNFGQQNFKGHEQSSNVLWGSESKVTMIHGWMLLSFNATILHLDGGSSSGLKGMKMQHYVYELNNAMYRLMLTKLSKQPPLWPPSRNVWVMGRQWRYMQRQRITTRFRIRAENIEPRHWESISWVVAAPQAAEVLLPSLTGRRASPEHSYRSRSMDPA